MNESPLVRSGGWLLRFRLQVLVSLGYWTCVHYLYSTKSLIFTVFCKKSSLVAKFFACGATGSFFRYRLHMYSLIGA